MSNDTEGNGRPVPEVSEKPIRRQFTAEYKLRIIEEADGCADQGQVVERRVGQIFTLRGSRPPVVKPLFSALPPDHYSFLSAIRYIETSRRWHAAPHSIRRIQPSESE